MVRAAAIAALLVCLAAPPCVRAATVRTPADPGPLATDSIGFEAARGERNRVHVRLHRQSIEIVDRGVERLAIEKEPGFDSCTRTGPRSVVCPRLPLTVRLRDRDDTFVADPGGHAADRPQDHPLELQDYYGNGGGRILRGVRVLGGRGADSLRGSRVGDELIPGYGRDSVDGRGGSDRIYLDPDGARDQALGGGGLDTLSFLGTAPRTTGGVWVELGEGTAAPADGSETDAIGGFERVHGSPHRDLLYGSDDGEAIYGEGGKDVVVGIGGADLLVGDSPAVPHAFANELVGGAGADVLDARGYASSPPPSRAPDRSSLDCGVGHDRVLTDTDDVAEPGCERSVFRITGDVDYPLYGLTLPVRPVERDADSATYEVACPKPHVFANGGCVGEVTVTRPAMGGEAPDELFGSASFDLEPGERHDVRVPLSPNGRPAQFVVVQVDARLEPPPDRSSDDYAAEARFGWEHYLPSPP